VSKPVRDTLRREIDARLPTGTVDHFESETGFVFPRAAVKRALAVGGYGYTRAEVLRARSDDTGAAPDAGDLVRVWLSGRCATVAVELTDGRSLALAALHGYIGHCALGRDGLSHISYVPSTNSARWPDYQGRREQIDALRASVAVAADHGRFQLASGAEARRFAEELRQRKAIDPALGLYAAYAFSQAGDDEEVRGIHDHMVRDLGTALFDIHMLSHRPTAEDGPPGNCPVVPAFPMLTQGWNLVGPRGVPRPWHFRRAAAYLTSSLWTTFEAGFARRLFKAIETGDL
jgi:hypothetical protein